MTPEEKVIQAANHLVGALKIAWGHHAEAAKVEMWEFNALDEALKELEESKRNFVTPEQKDELAFKCQQETFKLNQELRKMGASIHGNKPKKV